MNPNKTSQRILPRLLLLSISLSLLLAGCTGQGQSQGSVTEAPAAIYKSISETVAMPELMAVPEDLILDFYGLAKEDYSDAVFYISVDNLRADEIVIVKAVDEGAAARVKTILENRLQSKKDQAEGYSPEQFAIIEKCGVRVDGLTVAMLVSPDIDAINKVYAGFVK